MRELECSFELAISKEEMNKLIDDRCVLRSLLKLVYETYLEYEIDSVELSNGADMIAESWERNKDNDKRVTRGYIVTLYFDEHGKVTSAYVDKAYSYHIEIRLSDKWIRNLGVEEEFNYPGDFYDQLEGLLNNS